MTRPKVKHFVLAAGGTGGHFFPAESLAKVLVKRQHAVSLITDLRGFKYNHSTTIPAHCIRSATFSRRSIPGQLRAFLVMGYGFTQAYILLRKIKPTAVVGFGGYPSLPTVAAAVMNDIPLILHEQNALLGRANRLFSKNADLIAATFPLKEDLRVRQPVIVTGNPVREAFYALARRPYTAAEPDGEFQILVTGGSQGATIFSTVIPDALAKLPFAYRRRLRLVQQCRAEDIEQVTAIYREANIQATTASFITNIAEHLGKSHLAVCRAGASTVSELAVSGVPSILVPYPGSADQHQLMNARAIAEAEAGWLIEQADFNSNSFGDTVMNLMDNPETLILAAARARNLGVPDATEHLADLVELIGV